MTMAGVSPGDAASNLSMWASMLGIELAPSWVSQPTADFWVFVAAGVILIVALGLLFWPSAADHRNMAAIGSPTAYYSTRDGGGSPDDLPVADLSVWGQRDRFKAYQVPFLWMGYEPPDKRVWLKYANRDIYDLYEELQDEYERGRIKGDRSPKITWYERADLVKFAQRRGDKPRFLFPIEDRSDEHGQVPES